jgi:hypothetical protein
MKILTDEQKNELYGFSYVVLTVNPFINEKDFYKEIIKFAKRKNMPIEAVKKYLKESE